MAQGDVHVPLVLVVDDDQDNRDACTEYLRLSGLRVAEAVDGPEAVRLSAELRPDLILLDFQLPGIDGWEVTRQVRRDVRTKSIPIIVHSAAVVQGVEEQARRVGCQAFIAKPCLPSALLEEITRQVNGHN